MHKPSLKAAAAICRILDGLDERDRARVWRFVADEYSPGELE